MCTTRQPLLATPDPFFKPESERKQGMRLSTRWWRLTQLDKISDSSHDEESESDGLAGLEEFPLVGCLSIELSVLEGV